MLTKLARSFAILTAVAVVGLAPTMASAEKIKDAGSIEAAYVERDTRPIPDQEAHMLLLTKSSGKSTNPGGLIDGFGTTVHEMADLRQGNGPHQGYVVYQKGSDQQVVKYEGTVTTTMRDEQPHTTMKGKYVIVGGTGALAGIEGDGTYEGYFTSKDEWRVDWEGSRSQLKEAVAE